MPPHPQNVFKNYKKTAPSSISANSAKSATPPSPPKRKSSRNNSTLRLISTMKVHTDTSASFKRHESCFSTSSSAENNKVKYLRDKITCKLSPCSKKKDGGSRIKVTKIVSTKPNAKSKITSTLTTSKDPKTLANKIKSRTNITSTKTEGHGSTSKLSETERKSYSTCSKTETKERSNTFGVQKRKIDLVLPTTSKNKLVKSPDLVSPTEVKKAVIKQMASSSPKATYKNSRAIFSSVRNGIAGENKGKYLNIKAGISEQGKEILKSCHYRSCSSLPTTPLTVRSTKNPKPRKINSSLESLKSTDSLKKRVKTLGHKANVKKSTESELSLYKGISNNFNKMKKIRKDQLNGEIARKTKKATKLSDKAVQKDKCAGRAAGTEIAKQLRKMEAEEQKQNRTPDLNEIQKQREAVQSDAFFQHLLLRNIDAPLPRPSSRNVWLAEKTMQLQRRRPHSESNLGATAIYLRHTKPVTESKFRSLDVSIMRSRSVSPKSIGRICDHHNLASVDEDSEKKRSRSLPPKLIFSQTSRPVSPVVLRRAARSPTPPSIVYRSPSQKICRRTKSFQSEQRSSPALSYLSSNLARSTSSVDSVDKQEYQLYLKEMASCKRASSKFKDLNLFYSTLEKMGELERTTSSADLRPRRKHEDEIIDYDRWKEVRSRERAEKELNTLYKQLKMNEKEKGFLFRPKDVEHFKWKREFDRGLRIKEKSVEDIKEAFEKLKMEEKAADVTKRRLLDYEKDVYKPLWRGSSVFNLASNIIERRSVSEGRVQSVRQKLIESERLLTHGIGSRIWSSLSMEQVNTLKHQLNEIYSQNTSKRIQQDYSINVSPDSKHNHVPSLSVRRNSDISEPLYKSMTGTEPSNKERSHFSCVSRSDSLSENDKKRLSQSLSKEVLDRMSKQQKYKTSLSLVLGKETRGAIAAADANINVNRLEAESPRTCYSLEMSEDSFCEKDKKHRDSDFVLVLAKNDSQKSNIKETMQEWAQPKKALITMDVTSPNKMSSTSETESGSTDDSNRTVVYVEKKPDVQEKVEYFEKTAKINTYTPTIYKPSDEVYENGDDSLVSHITDSNENLSSKLSSSQSYQNFKELFGENDLARFATVPLSASRKQLYIPPHKPMIRATTISPIRTITPSNSNESLYRSRSLSPYFGETYALARSGEVRRLKNQFEFTNKRVLQKHRRWKSDDQLHKTIFVPGQSSGDVDMLRKKYEYPAIAGRGRSRTRRGGVVSPIFLRAEDRFMPHINIISKIASLYPKRSVASALFDRRRGNEELAQILGCPIGEVERLRQKFDSSDNISLLGHMFTSSPNIHELRDIAPYLAAEWTAHRYPRIEDNTRSLSSPEQSVASRDLSIVRRSPRPKSASPTRPKKPLSILKSPRSVFAKQTFDPKVQRYQPPLPSKETVKFRSWWPPTSTHARPSVTFKGGV